MLTPEQLAGAEFLAARKVAGLFDRVGFGKTAQCVRACDLIRAERVTIICPPILRPNEIREFDKWSLFGYPAAIVRTGKDPVPRDGLVAVSYELAHVPRIKRLLLERRPDVLILDEAHRVKSPGAKRTKAIFGKAGVASTAERVWFVTGEPTPNSAAEYYVFAKACGAWSGNQAEFIERYCVTIETDFGPKIVGNKRERVEELRGLLRPHVLQRDGIDPDRPPLTVDEIPIEGARPDFSGIDPAALQRIENAALAGDWSSLDDPFVSTVRRLVGLAKAESVAELAATELEGGGGKTLVFCGHTAVIDGIAARLERFGAAVIDGRTPATRRQEIIDAFQGPGGPRVIVAHIRAAGEGLTLTAADRVLLAEPAWSPAENTQAIARAWRRGQTKPVRASFCYLAGSIDEAVSRSLSRKMHDVAQLRVE